MFSIKTGQIDLEGLKKFFLTPLDTSLSGSSNNTSGFYPYTGNPAQFISTGDVHTISGHISGYIDSVSGVLRADLNSSGVDLSGYTTTVNTTLKSDIVEISGDIREVSGDLRFISGRLTGAENDIDTVSGNLATSGESLSVLITGGVGTGLSGFLTGHVRDTSGELNTKITNLDTSLKAHISSDYLSKKDVNSDVSGTLHYEKTPHLNKGLYIDKVTNQASVSAIQSGSIMYNMVEGHTEGGVNYEVMTNYMRMPHSGQSDPYENIIVNSVMYKASDNIIT
tara:strand:- start:2995 stop:3837 length:843 start_codon:yes stop_codon:yes gene_type:complete